MEKLEFYKYFLLWVGNYLLNRNQVVAVDGWMSLTLPVISGIFQVLVLGPLQ